MSLLCVWLSTCGAGLAHGQVSQISGKGSEETEAGNGSSDV